MGLMATGKSGQRTPGVGHDADKALPTHDTTSLVQRALTYSVKT